jgi:hypothetical protein
MELRIEVLNTNALDLLHSLEKLQLIKFVNKKPKAKSIRQLTETEFEAKVLASKASNISYHFKGNEFNEMANRLLNKEPVDLEKYKIID